MDKHSRWIRFLTLALPIFSVALIAVVFLYDWSSTEEVQSQFEEDDRSFNEEVQAQVQAPTVTALTNEGDEITITAQTLQQESQANDNIIGNDVEGDVQVGGSQWEIQSTEGETDSQGRVAEFRGQVMALIDGEYNLLGSQLIANVGEREFVSEFPIDVESERFDLTADAASLSGVRGERVITLKGNVKGVIRLENYTSNERNSEEDAETQTSEGEGNEN